LSAGFALTAQLSQRFLVCFFVELFIVGDTDSGELSGGWDRTLWWGSEARQIVERVIEYCRVSYPNVFQRPACLIDEGCVYLLERIKAFYHCAKYRRFAV
jgi:hypothetical protein